MKQPAKTQALHDLIAPAVAACNVQLWGVEFLQQGRRSLLRVYIDKDSASDDAAIVPAEDAVAGDNSQGRGVDVNDCARVTHQVSGILDVHDPISGEYALEVSSPGWDRPFFSLDQMRTYIGQTVALRLISPVDQRRKLSGILQSMTEDAIVLAVDDKLLDIESDNIDKANLVYQD